MPKVRPLTSLVCRTAWQITLGAIRSAAQKAHCQYRGAVVVLEPVTGATVFIADINPDTAEESRQSYRRIAEQVAVNSRTTKKPLKLDAVDGIVARVATKDGMMVAVAMSEYDAEYAKAFARTMASMLNVGQSIILDRRPAEDQGVPDEGPPTLILARVPRAAGGNLI